MVRTSVAWISAFVVMGLVAGSISSWMIAAGVCDPSPEFAESAPTFIWALRVDGLLHMAGCIGILVGAMVLGIILKADSRRRRWHAGFFGLAVAALLLTSYLLATAAWGPISPAITWASLSVLLMFFPAMLLFALVGGQLAQMALGLVPFLRETWRDAWHSP